MRVYTKNDKRKRALALLRSTDTDGSNKYTISGRLKETERRPITLVRIPTLEKPDDYQDRPPFVIGAKPCA